MTMKKSDTAMKGGLRIHILCYVLANLIQVLVWGLFTPEQHFWPLWSILAWGTGLAFHIWAVYSPSRVNARN
jgi:cytochrome c oxidase assembly factor CtaG